MKRLIPAFLTLTLIITASVSSANAQSDVIAKQRAKGIRDANNAQQGVPSAAPTAPPASSSAPSLAPSGPQGISPVQQQKIDKLEAGLSSIKTGTQLTTEQQQLLQSNVLDLVRGTRPSKESIAKLSTDLAALLADKAISIKDHAPLAKSINIVVNSANLAPAQVQAIISSAQAPLKAGGASDAQAQSIAADLKAIVTELQKTRSKLYQ
jgi:hypothetical protein